MQLKNSNTVAMDKRMDLASLFCMIGRHGPAVAVAVIAMVSVLAGFIIYRNVKGKRRKAPAGDENGGSPGTQADGESQSRTESTDESDDLPLKPDDDGTSGLLIRTRRTTGKKPHSLLKKDCEPGEKLTRSPMQYSVHVQNPTCTVAEDTLSAKKKLEDCSQSCDEVLATEEKMTTEDVGHLKDSIQTDLEKLACSQSAESQIKERKDEEDTAPETKCDLLTRDTEDGDKPVDHAEFAENGSDFLQPEDEPTGNVEQDFEKRLDSCDVVTDHTMPSSNQSMEADCSQCNPVCTDVQPKEVKDDSDAVLDNSCFDPEIKCFQEKNNTAKAVSAEEGVIHTGFASMNDSDLAAIANESVAKAAEMSHAEVSSFNDQTGHLDLKITPTLAAEVIEGVTSSAFEPIELIWSTGPGEESGISSMTVSPALDDAEVECDAVPANAMPLLNCSEFENPARDQLQVCEGDIVAVFKEKTVEAPESLSQKKDEHGNSSTKDNLDHGDVYLSNDQSAVHISKPEKIEVKKVVDQLRDNEKTEISIMAATMDHNEWITDGNYQVLPWMNLSVPCLTQNQTGLVSTKEHHNHLITDQSGSEGNPPSEVKQSICPHVDESDKKVVAVQPMPQNVNVTFCTHYLTHSPSQKVAITGNQQELGNWKDFIPLERVKDGQWVTTVSLAVESPVEWKFVLLDKGKVSRWEECGNRLLHTGHGENLVVREWWGFL